MPAATSKSRPPRLNDPATPMRSATYQPVSILIAYIAATDATLTLRCAGQQLTLSALAVPACARSFGASAYEPREGKMRAKVTAAAAHLTAPRG